MAISLDKQTLRKLLFTPCKSKEDLQRFIKIFLGLELPDCTVDPESNSNPMDLVYYVYNKTLQQDDENFSGVLYYAARDSFKCVEKGTKLLLKNKQLINIENAKIGDIIWTGFSWQPINNWIHDGIKDALRLNLENGLQLTTSPIHKVWSWQPNAEPSWKQVSELSSDDLVCIDTSPADNIEPISIEEFELGYLIGIIQGDGCTTMMGVTSKSGKKYNHITLSTADQYIVDFWSKQCLKYAGKLPTRSKSRPYDYFINSRQFVDFLQKIGIKACYSWEKDIPEICFNSKSYMLGFISGLYDTDGTFIKEKNIVQFQLTAKTLLKKLQIMLLSLGINCKFIEGKKLYGIQRHLVHNVAISQYEVRKFLNCGIKSFVSNKANNIYTVSLPKIYDAHDSIPRSQAQALFRHLPTKGSRIKRIGSKPRINTYKTTSRFKMLDLVKYGKNNNYLSIEQNIKWNNILQNKWIKVKNITKIQADLYDLTVENDHSYWSNGIISHNTLSSSIMQLLFALHLDFNCSIAAAIEQQASISAGYLKNWLNKSHFREFITAENERKIEINRFEHAKNGEILTLAEYEKLDLGSQTSYVKKGAYTQIVVATIKSMNGFHVPLLCLDEMDIAPERPIQEGKMMMTTGPKGQLPVLLMTSTRKYAFGPVQKEINKVEAGESNLKVFHWNLIDVTQSCPSTRHRPDEPLIDLYTNKDKLLSINSESYDGLPSDEQLKYTKSTAFAGCATCKLHPMCMTRLATDQKCKSKMLKPIPHVINLFKNVDADTAKAQLLCFAIDTQILMANGTCKNIQDIQINDIVITHKGNIKKVTNIFKRYYDNNILKIDHLNWKCNSTLVTPEHPYFINGKEFQKIQDLNLSFIKNENRVAGDYLSFPIKYEENNQINFKYTDFVKDIPLFYEDNNLISIKTTTSRSRPIPMDIVLDEEWGWIIGFFLAEGNFQKRQYSKKGRKYINSITFNTHMNEIEFHQKIRNFAKKLNLTTSEFQCINTKGYIIDIYNTTLATLFYNLVGELCHKKFIHNKLMNLNLKFLESILIGFFDGDGSKTTKKRPGCELVTTSYNLVTQLFLIAARLGFNPRIKKKKIGKGGRYHPYLLYFQNLQHHHIQKKSKFKINNNYNLYRHDKIEIQSYKGFVYNIEVEDDHSYIANGVAVHNCWRPGKEGLVYPNFEVSRHMITASQMAEKITGEPTFPTFSKSQLLALAQKYELPFYSGMDFGYTHFFAVVTGFVLGNSLFVVDVIAQPHLEDMEKVEVCNRRIKYLNPTLFPDPASPQTIKLFRKFGYSCKNFKKNVLGGIEIVRAKLNPGIASPVPEIYFLKYDDGCESMAKLIKEYSWMLDSEGNPTDIPNEKNDDQLDCIRYLCQNLFSTTGKIKTGDTLYTEPVDNDPNNWISKEIERRVDPTERSEGDIEGKRGNLHFKF